MSSIGVEELRSGSRRRPVVEARRALAQVAVEELGHRRAAVARYLGVATSTANRGLGYGEPSPLAQRLLEGHRERMKRAVGIRRNPWSG